MKIFGLFTLGAGSLLGLLGAVSLFAIAGLFFVLTIGSFLPLVIATLIAFGVPVRSVGERFWLIIIAFAAGFYFQEVWWEWLNEWSHEGERYL